MQNILIRVDGNKKIGMGHLYRDVDIAFELEKHGNQVSFLIQDFPEAIQFLEEKKCNYIILKANSKSNQTSIEKIKDFFHEVGEKFDIVILDLLKDFDNQDYLNIIKNYVNKLIILSDRTKPFYIDVDIVFALSQHQSQKYYQDIKTTSYYTGLEYFPIKPNFKNVKKKIIFDTVQNILLIFGGSDPNNFTYNILTLLKTIQNDFNLNIIVGSGYTSENYNQLLKFEMKNLTIHRNVCNISNFMEKTDVCICSAGNTLIELLTCGVPCIVLPQTERENDHAIGFERKEMIINLGLNFSKEKFITEFLKIVKSPSLRKKMSRNAQKNHDGKV